jgi:hypothetical protein
VPEELRETLRSQQKTLYPLLMKAAAEAIIELCRDPRHVGGTPGVLAVLHTWTQQLLYHPHVHCLVTGGGISNASWHPARRNFLLPYAALAKLVRGKLVRGKLMRGKLMAALAKRCPDLALPKAVWRKPWVVHCTPWGEGAEAVLRYLARYVFRTAISNSRIESLDGEGVTFRHKHRASNRWRRTRLSGHEFMRRFLQHVLPQGLHKVRYYGLWHPSKREEAAKVRLLLQVRSSSAPLIAQSTATAVHPSQTAGASDAGTPPVRPCPCCGQGRLLCVRRLYPKQPEGP